MSDPRPDPIEAWAELSARTGRASAARATAIVRMDRPRRPAPAVAGFGVLTVAVILIGSALIVRPGVAPAASQGPGVSSPANGAPAPIHVTTADGTFRLDLDVPTSHYVTTDAIAPVATVTYIGPDATATVFHGASTVMFRIKEVGGNRDMDGGMDQPCLSTAFTKGGSKAYPFEKAGSPSDDPALGFDRAWFQDPTLRLPAGQWLIFAELDVELGGCGAAAERHQLTQAAEVIVIPDDADNGPVTASQGDDTLRLTLTTPHGIYDPNDAIQPVASIAYFGPQAEATIFTDEPVVLFSLEELGGGRRMDPIRLFLCVHTRVDQAAPLTFPFEKAGGSGTSFDSAWYRDPVLRLPVGTWRIRAELMAETTDGTDPCGGIPHNFAVENIIDVVDSGAPVPAPSPSNAASPSPSPVPSALPSFSLDPVVGSADDAMFRLDLTTPHGIYGPPDAIEPLATVTFLGPDATVTFDYGEPYVLFAVEEVGGDRQFEGSGSEVGSTATLARGEPKEFPFALHFNQAWLDDPVLRLPAGTWRITATLSVYLGPYGDSGPRETHQFTVENLIHVVEGAGIDRSTAASSDVAVAQEFVGTGAYSGRKATPD